MPGKYRKFVFLAFVVSVALWTGSAPAQSLSKLAPNLLQNDGLVRAAQADLDGAKERARVSLGSWFPNLTVTGSYGHEVQKPELADDTTIVPRDLNFSVTQLFWDFGATNSGLRSARFVIEQADAALAAARQDILLQAVTAYINVMKAQERLNFAIQSEDNVKKQTELENALVERGAGFSTDVLQAKVQLAGAQARRVVAEGALANSRNAYREVFKTNPGPIKDMMKPVLPLDLLPVSIQDAVIAALRLNPQLRASRVANFIAREDVKSTRASQFFPKIEGVAETKFKNDIGGTIGDERETLAKVQMTWPFNLGFTAVNTLRASEKGALATENRFSDAEGLIEQQVRDSWDNLDTAKKNAALLQNQANIAAEFLEQARKERKLGRRSLLDVLNGETVLINANSDASSAEADVAIAGFTLLSATGRLNVDAVSRAPGGAKK